MNKELAKIIRREINEFNKTLPMEGKTSNRGKVGSYELYENNRKIRDKYEELCKMAGVPILGQFDDGNWKYSQRDEWEISTTYLKLGFSEGEIWISIRQCGR